MLTPAVADRVAETTTTTGTGTLSLAGASAAFRSFVAGVGDGRVVEYTLVDRASGAWEVGVGTVTAGSPNTLSRDRVKSSSTGSLLTLAAGTKDVFIAMPSARGTTSAQLYLAASS